MDSCLNRSEARTSTDFLCFFFFFPSSAGDGGFVGSQAFDWSID